jgi:hypothetical protein
LGSTNFDPFFILSEKVVFLSEKKTNKPPLYIAWLVGEGGLLSVVFFVLSVFKTVEFLFPPVEPVVVVMPLALWAMVDLFVLFFLVFLSVLAG